MRLSEDGPDWLDNAVRVARERFPEVIDLDSEYYVAKLLAPRSKKRAKIKAACAKHDKKWMESGYVGRYYKVTRSGLVFVVAAPELIIHVFKISRGSDSICR